VIIKVDTCVLNPSDILFLRGKYNVKSKYPYTPGWEGSGTVVKCGESKLAQSFMGKRVAFTKVGEVGEYKIGGAYADYTTGDCSMLIPIPDKLSFEDASAWVVNPWTAVGMVERCI
jgi:NADPH:quinone reductase|tara:strand:- start:113 stop:460 length:348 start_codon:yes stop_codon:yes gene_type:complete